MILYSRRTRVPNDFFALACQQNQQQFIAWNATASAGDGQISIVIWKSNASKSNPLYWIERNIVQTLNDDHQNIVCIG